MTYKQLDVARSQKFCSDTANVCKIIDVLDEIFAGKVPQKCVGRLRDDKNKGKYYYDTADICFYIDSLLNCGRHAVSLTLRVYKQTYITSYAFPDDDVLRNKFIRVEK